MDDTTEDILLKKTGRNRMAIEKMEKELEALKKLVSELSKKITNVVLMVEAAGIEDRESFLRGE
ncbi:hypothetical protein LCGC14_1106760 [marine sediment metagenome]|uniref:Uncharacterized protein n=1 Tax=marine sediment metagenome TaxID=412755 RepID=A0A0F9M7W9_9ZZZZ